MASIIQLNGFVNFPWLVLYSSYTTQENGQPFELCPGIRIIDLPYKAEVGVCLMPDCRLQLIKYKHRISIRLFSGFPPFFLNLIRHIISPIYGQPAWNFRMKMICSLNFLIRTHSCQFKGHLNRLPVCRAMQTFDNDESNPPNSRNQLAYKRRRRNSRALPQ